MTEQKTTKTETSCAAKIPPISPTMEHDTKTATKGQAERKTEPGSPVEQGSPSTSASTHAPQSPVQAPTKAVKSELYDPLSPSRSPDEYNWAALSENIANFRAKSDRENLRKESKEFDKDFSSHGNREFKKEFRNFEDKEYRTEFGSHCGKGYNKESKDFASKGFKAEFREYREYENECREFKGFNKACTSFRSYDPLEDVSYLYEPKRTALKSHFASQLEQYFILDTPFTLTKSIEEDYPAPSNEFLVPPKWDLYAELFLEQAAEAHNWSFFERKMVGVTDSRLVKAQNAIVRASGPLIRTLGTKVATDRNSSYHAIWISIGYAFWFLSRIRRQLLLEAVLGTRDRKRIDRYLSDANKMSMFWPDNSDLLGKKFYDHIVQSEKRQEEFRDVLMKDVRRFSDQRDRKHELLRRSSTGSRHQVAASSFHAHEGHYKVRSSSCEQSLRHTIVHPSSEEVCSKHGEASIPSERRGSKHAEASVPSERRGSKHAEACSEERPSKDSKVRASSEEHGKKQSKVSTSHKDRSSKHDLVSNSSERHNSRHAEARPPNERRNSRHDEVTSSSERRRSRNSDIRSEDRPSKHAKISASSEEPKSKHADSRNSREKRRPSEVRTTCKERSLRYTEVCISIEERSSKYVENSSSADRCSTESMKISCRGEKRSSKNSEVRTHGESRSSKFAETREERGERYEEAKLSGRHGDRRDSEKRISSDSGDVKKSPQSYKGIPLFSDMIVSDSPLQHEQGSIPSRMISDEKNEKNKLSMFPKRSSKLSRRVSEASSKRDDTNPEISPKTGDNVTSSSPEIDLRCEAYEEEDEEEEGEIRDIFTPFSIKKREGSKSSSKKTEEISKSVSEKKEVCSRSDPVVKEDSPKSSSKKTEDISESVSERKEICSKSNPEMEGDSSNPTQENKEDSSKALSKQKGDCSKLNSNNEEANIGSLFETEKESFEFSSERKENIFNPLKYKRRCNSEESREFRRPLKRRRVRSCEYSSACNEDLVKQKTEELAAQFDKNMKLEVEFTFLKDTNKKLNDVNRELEDNLQSNQELLERKGGLISDLERQLDQLRRELDQVKEERTTFQTLACEKDSRISNLKTDNEAFKLKERGWNMEKKKLAVQVEELQTQVSSQSKLLIEREDNLKKLQRDIDLLNSDQTVNEQHRQQLTNLRLEIEQRKDKEKMFELERLRLEKDKLVQEIETKAKLQHGMMEKTFDQLTDENSKLKANLVALESQLQSQNQEIEEERETTAMFKAEAERDIKLQKQNAAMELEELKTQAAKRDATFQEKISALQLELQNRPSGAGVNTGDGSTNTDPAVSPDTEQLALQLRDQTREIENLRAVRARCLQVAVTQFQKGDTVFFYYDEGKSNYLVANVSPNEYQYFLHPDNLGALGLSLEPAGRKPWAIGVIKDKEFCQARKVNNRFKVPEGRKFYRVYAQPRANPDPNNAPNNAPTNSRNPD